MFRKWRVRYREEKTKFCSLVEGTTGGKFWKDGNLSIYFTRVCSKEKLHFHSRLDIKNQKIDKGYPRYTDVVFGGVPNDSHDVFQYKGE